MHSAISLDASANLSEYMASLKMVFAANLRRLLTERNIKAKDLAVLLGVTASNVSHWRNAERFPAPENIDKLCHVFKINYAELFREDGEPNPEKIDVESALVTLAKAMNYNIIKKPKRSN